MGKKTDNKIDGAGKTAGTKVETAPVVKTVPPVVETVPPVVETAPMVETVPPVVETAPMVETVPPLGMPSRGFRQRIAGVVPGGRGFKTREPMAKVRLEEALSRAMGLGAHLKTARGVLESLKAETVTGTDRSGAVEILGDELPEFEALLESMERGFAVLCGEAEE